MDWIVTLSIIGMFLSFFAILTVLPFCIIALVCFIKNEGIKGVTIVGGFLTFCMFFGFSTFGYYAGGARGGGSLFFLVSIVVTLVYAGITVLGFVRPKVTDSK